MGIPEFTIVQTTPLKIRWTRSGKEEIISKRQLKLYKRLYGVK